MSHEKTQASQEQWAARQQMSAQLVELGVRPGGVLLVHSSLKSLGKVAGGAETVVQALIGVLGDQGTLLMPALSYLHVGPDQPHFDARQTPSNVGALPEYFRTRPGTRRSVHPTHSVCALGRLAHSLLSAHWQDHTPCGSHSPFHAMRRLNGQVLFLGCGLRPNTSMHAVEEMVEPPYLLGETVLYHCRTEAGKSVEMAVRRHNFQGYEQRYDRLEPLLTPQQLRQGTLLQAHCHLVECAAMWDAALKALRADPLHFVQARASGLR